MSSLHFIGGEKGGVGKSVVARLLAQYFIDKGQPFVGFDTDRSHTTFTRFYADYAAPVPVDRYEGLDQIVRLFEPLLEGGDAPRVVVDLAAQTAAPLARWAQDSDLLPLLAEMGVSVHFWHVADPGKDSADLLAQLLQTHGPGPRYIVVKNLGRGSDFAELDACAALREVRDLGGQVLTLPALHEASMRKIDRQNASFWAALQNRTGPDSLGLLERQRVKAWLRTAYAALDPLAL